jgi:hypothetical protein
MKRIRKPKKSVKQKFAKSLKPFKNPGAKNDLKHWMIQHLILPCFPDAAALINDSEEGYLNLERMIEFWFNGDKREVYFAKSTKAFQMLGGYVYKPSNQKRPPHDREIHQGMPLIIARNIIADEDVGTRRAPNDELVRIQAILTSDFDADHLYTLTPSQFYAIEPHIVRTDKLGGKAI